MDKFRFGKVGWFLHVARFRIPYQNTSKITKILRHSNSFSVLRNGVNYHKTPIKISPEQISRGKPKKMANLWNHKIITTSNVLRMKRFFCITQSLNRRVPVGCSKEILSRSKYEIKSYFPLRYRAKNKIVAVKIKGRGTRSKPHHTQHSRDVAAAATVVAHRNPHFRQRRCVVYT